MTMEGLATKFTNCLLTERIEWEALVRRLLNLLDKGEIDPEEVSYPIAANVFNGVEMAVSVILV